MHVVLKYYLFIGAYSATEVQIVVLPFNYFNSVHKLESLSTFLGGSG